MIHEFFTRHVVRKDELLSFLNTLGKDLKGIAEVKVIAEDIHGSLRVGDEVICSVKISRDLCEYYLKIRDVNYLDLLSKSGFKELRDIIVSYSTSFPSEVVVSKVMPSRAIYILMSSREVPKAFPSIRIIYREGFYEASSSYCRLSSDEDTCNLLMELLNLAKKYWIEMFK